MDSFRVVSLHMNYRGLTIVSNVFGPIVWKVYKL